MKKKTLALLLSLFMTAAILIPSSAAVKAMTQSGDAQVILHDNTASVNQADYAAPIEVINEEPPPDTSSPFPGGDTGTVPEPSEYIELDKDVTENADGSYTVTMEAYILGDVFTVSSAEPGNGMHASYLVCYPGVEIGPEGLIREIIPSCFATPQTADIKIYTAYYEGEGTWKPREAAAGLTVTVSSGKIEVTGFDYAENFIAENPRYEDETSTDTDFYGKKLIIEFDLKLKTGFLGGNNIPVSGEGTGFYYKNYDDIEINKNFPLPQLDIPLPEIEIKAADRHVYLLHQYTDKELSSAAEFIIHGDTDIKLDLSKEKNGLEPWQYEYADVRVSIKYDYGPHPLTEDCTYSLKFEIFPLQPGTETGKTVETTKNICVYKPVITFADKKVGYGDEIDLTKGPESVEWMHGTDTEDAGRMSGTKPDIGYDYYIAADPDVHILSPDAFRFIYQNDQYIKVKTDIDDTDITSETVFKHSHCTLVDDCPLNGSEITNGAPGQFMIHIKNNCSLTITKTAAEGTVFEPGDTFVVCVTRTYDFGIIPGNEIYIMLTADENGEVTPVTVDHLYPGTYNIADIINWSWKYSVVSSNQEMADLERGDTVNIEFSGRDWGNNMLHWDTVVDIRLTADDAAVTVIIPHKKPELPVQS